MGASAESLRKVLPVAETGIDPGPGVSIAAAEDPYAFWRQLLGALEHGRSAMLVDPGWPKDWTRHARSIASELGSLSGPRMLIPTSGSTGRPKFCNHTIDTLGAAAEGYAARFGHRGIIHAVNILPQHHVGGLMPVFRSAACGGKVHFADYRNSASIDIAPFPLEEASISVVPTQLRRMLADKPTRAVLRRFALIFVGGATCPSDLLESARGHELPLSPCYGATETAAMVTAMEPEAFLAGDIGVGTPLTHAQIEIDPDQRVLVRSPSLLLGYLPIQNGFSRDPFTTGDLGRIDDSGNLHILGRADRVIITGGEKVHPEQVESAALSTGLVTTARCKGVPDSDWGQRVELWVDANPKARNQLLEELRRRLPAFAVPKAINALDEFRVKSGGPSSLKENL